MIDVLMANRHYNYVADGWNFLLNLEATRFRLEFPPISRAIALASVMYQRPAHVHDHICGLFLRNTHEKRLNLFPNQEVAS